MSNEMEINKKTLPRMILLRNGAKLPVGIASFRKLFHILAPSFPNEL